jgi:hypothetical protein
MAGKHPVGERRGIQGSGGLDTTERINFVGAWLAREEAGIADISLLTEILLSRASLAPTGIARNKFVGPVSFFEENFPRESRALVPVDSGG